MTIYSRKMQAIFHRAQLEAERFESPFLETWHVLLAMVEVPGSVAYLTFTDFEDRIHSEEIETAAVLANGEEAKRLVEIRYYRFTCTVTCARGYVARGARNR